MTAGTNRRTVSRRIEPPPAWGLPVRWSLLWAYASRVKVIASPGAVDFVRERGGKLFVWSKSTRCCRGVTYLEASTERNARRLFRRVPADGIELYVDIPRLPAQLEIDVHGRFRRRARAYWDGCAWVT
jgi:hypothetical protein